MAEHELFKAKACPECRKPYLPRQVLYGWQPCRCAGATGGGHITALCCDDTGGCGFTFAEGHVGPEEPPERMPNFGQVSARPDVELDVRQEPGHEPAEHDGE